MWAQHDACKDYKQLKAGEALSRSSYYDRTDQVGRIGGRLQFTDIPEETKHQIVLPHGHKEVATLTLDVHSYMPVQKPCSQP